MVKWRYPLPRVEDLIDKIGTSSVFTSIDLWSAYHLVQIKEGDEWKTAFTTTGRLFEWLVMPFGLTNAPASFQNLINTVLGDLVDRCVIIYLDDILVHSPTREQNIEDTKEVLRRLRDYNLYVS